MIKTLFYTSERNHSYLYDDQHRLSMLIHPEFRKAHVETTDVDPYYLKKNAYLRKHGFFGKPEPVSFKTVTEEMIKNSVIQTPHIVFEVTDSCNLNCTYCVYGKIYDGFDTRNQKNISIRSAKKLLKYVFDLKRSNNNNKLIIGFYGGETLLNINFIKQIVETAHQLNVEKEMKLDYSISTNATLIHRHIDFLVANKFLLYISLDGNEKNHSYRVFGKNNKNSFHKVIENVDMIQRDYPEYFADRVNFLTVLHNRNSVKDIYEFIFARYHKNPMISELSFDDIKPDHKELAERMYHNKRKSEAEYQKEESNLLPETPHSILNKEITDFLKYFSINCHVTQITSLLNDEEKYFPTSTCLPFSRKIFLTNRNKLLPCERINYKYTVGKVNKDVIIDIPEITRQYNFYYDHLKKVCQYCYDYRFCGLCMFSVENLDRLETEEFVCNQFCDQKSFQEKMYRIFSFLEKEQIAFSHMLETKIEEEERNP